MPTGRARMGQIANGAVNTAKAMSGATSTSGGVILKAKAGNATPIYIGHDNTVTDLTGFPLAAGESVLLEVLNIGQIWMYGATAADRLCWVATNAS